jgi:hypothetical protein
VAIGTLFTLFVIPVAYTYIVGDRRPLADEGAGGGAVAPGHTPANRLD